jgi:hypothetical protein
MSQLTHCTNESAFIDACIERIGGADRHEAMFQRLQRDMVLAVQRETDGAVPLELVDAVAQAIGSVVLNVARASALPGHQRNLIDEMLRRAGSRAVEVLNELQP